MIYIIGAGPAGCALAYYFSKRSIPATVIEASSQLGGMSRSFTFESGISIDTGPHIFHSPDPEITEDWLDICPENLVEQHFHSYLCKNSEFDQFIHYPISRESLSDAGYHDLVDNINDSEPSQSFINYRDFMQHRVGPELEELFYRYYPEKLWGLPTSQMRADWAPKRVQVRDSKLPFFAGQFCAAHHVGAGYFYSELAEKSTFAEFNLNSRVSSVIKDNQIISKLVTTNNVHHINDDDIVISTIPLPLLGSLLGIKAHLDYRGVCIVTLLVDGKFTLPNDAAWMYFDQSTVPFTRITNHSLVSPGSTPNKDQTLLSFEIPYSAHSDSLSSETDDDIFRHVISSCAAIPFIEEQLLKPVSVIKEPFVYPLREFRFEETLLSISSAIDNIANLFSIGSSGEFVYGDSQITFRKCKDFVDDYLSDLSNDTFIVRKSKSTSAFSTPSTKTPWDSYIQTGVTERPLLISEAGINHNGSIHIAKQLIQESFASGADAIKFQLYDLTTRASSNSRDAFYVEHADGEGENLYQLFRRVHFTIDQIKELKLFADNVGIPLFVSAFDTKSLLEAAEIDNSCIKLSSMDLTNYDLWSLSPSLFNHIIASTGMSTIEEVKRSVSLFHRKNKANSFLTLLHCVSSYPLSLNDACLGSMDQLSNICSNVGYSDHSLSILPAFAAAIKGATVIEKHFTLDRSQEGPDHIHSLDRDSMKELSTLLSNFPNLLNSRSETILPCESREARRQKKGCYLIKDCKAGDLFTSDCYELRAPCVGLDSFDVRDYLDMPFGIDVSTGSAITRDFFASR